MNTSFWLGLLFYALIALFIYLFFFKFRNFFHRTPLGNLKKSHKILTAVVVIITSLAATIPMSFHPLFNGEIPQHRNQYELMADSLLHGHLYLDYDDVDPRLAELDNPYDRTQRDESGIPYHWDHAFYNGQYYMYFGVVPVILLFIPFQLITGASLPTYHAVQIFAVLFIIGIFALFYYLARRFFGKISYALYLMLAVATSAISLWYIVAVPTLYTVPIVSGLCFQIWSFYCFFRVAFAKEGELSGRKQFLLLFLGSLFGALVFGCRPPIALGGTIVILPLAVKSLQEQWRARRGHWLKFLLQLLLAVCPYIIIGILLMLYNYARFGSATEFGQTYQLTVTDQTTYSNFFAHFQPLTELSTVLEQLIGFNGFTETFPYLTTGGVLMTFPIFLLGLLALTQAPVRTALKKSALVPLLISLLVAAVVVIFMDTYWSPTPLVRYHSDVYFLFAILTFITLSFYYSTLSSKSQEKSSIFLSICAIYSVICCALFFFIPGENASILLVYPDIPTHIKSILTLGLG